MFFLARANTAILMKICVYGGKKTNRKGIG